MSGYGAGGGGGWYTAVQKWMGGCQKVPLCVCVKEREIGL